MSGLSPFQFLFLIGDGLGNPQLRASTEHLLSVRGARAQGITQIVLSVLLLFFGPS
jgi:hypothetical protein